MIITNWALKNIPGTTLPYTDQNAQAFSYIRPLITAAGGLSLSQICTISGLEGSTIQNWVKRGWIGGSLRSKKYNEKQVARILILSALRNCLQLDYIARLMVYVNGAVNDTSDDIIEEGELFSYMCGAARSVGLNVNNAGPIIDGILTDYPNEGDKKERLRKALMVMVYACVSSELQETANLKLMEII